MDWRSKPLQQPGSTLVALSQETLAAGVLTLIDWSSDDLVVSTMVAPKIAFELSAAAAISCNPTAATIPTTPDSRPKTRAPKNAFISYSA
jgi:hypothetical protein